jgi:hypothetical protein
MSQPVSVNLRLLLVGWATLNTFYPQLSPLCTQGITGGVGPDIRCPPPAAAHCWGDLLNRLFVRSKPVSQQVLRSQVSVNHDHIVPFAAAARQPAQIFTFRQGRAGAGGQIQLSIIDSNKPVASLQFPHVLHLNPPARAVATKLLSPHMQLLYRSCSGQHYPSYLAIEVECG